MKKTSSIALSTQSRRGDTSAALILSTHEGLPPRLANKRAPRHGELKKKIEKTKKHRMDFVGLAYRENELKKTYPYSTSLYIFSLGRDIIPAIRSLFLPLQTRKDQLRLTLPRR